MVLLPDNCHHPRNNLYTSPPIRGEKMLHEGGKGTTNYSFTKDSRTSIIGVFKVCELDKFRLRNVRPEYTAYV